MYKLRIWPRRSYRNRDGVVVTIVSKEKNGNLFIHIGDDKRRYYDNGRFSQIEESPYDLICDVTHEVHKGIFIDDRPSYAHEIPNVPLYFIWNPEGAKPVRYLFTKIAKAEKAAVAMARRIGNGSVFYVAHLLSAHQQQVESVKFDMKLNITGFGQ